VTALRPAKDPKSPKSVESAAMTPKHSKLPHPQAQQPSAASLPMCAYEHPDDTKISRSKPPYSDTLTIDSK